MAFGNTPSGGSDVVSPDVGAAPAVGAPSVSARLNVKPGTLIGERYEVVRLLGEGGMGAVYEARHVAIGRLVAIKLLRPELAVDPNIASRFLQEARAANEVRHRNIVEIIDFGTDDGKPYLVMELLRGESLQALLDREAPLSIGRIIRLLDPIVRALAFAHDRGIVHRDVKPENIYLAREDAADEPMPKLLDFGIAKRFDDDNLRLTATGITMGTPAYMAPEQAAGARALTGAADQYAIGAILYEALTGHIPHEAETFNAMIVMRATAPAARVDQYCPELDADLVNIIMRTLALNPRDRYASLNDLRVALEPFGRVEDSAPHGARVVSRHGRTVRDGSPVVGETMVAGAMAIPMLGSSGGVVEGAARTQQTGTPVGAAPSEHAVSTAPFGSDAGSQAGLMQTVMAADASGAHVPAKYPTPAPNVRIDPAADLDMLATTPRASRVDFPIPRPMQPRADAVVDGPPRRSAEREDFGVTRMAPVRRRTSGSMRVPALAAGALVIVVAGVFVLALVRGRPPAVAPNADAPASSGHTAAPAVGEPVTFTFDFEPSNAEISLDDVALGSGHAAVTRPRTGHRYQLRVTAPGHEPYSEVVAADSNARISHRLQPLSPGASAQGGSTVAPPVVPATAGIARPSTAGARPAQRGTSGTSTAGSGAATASTSASASATGGSPSTAGAVPSGASGASAAGSPGSSDPPSGASRPRGGHRPNIDRENPFGP